MAADCRPHPHIPSYTCRENELGWEKMRGYEELDLGVTRSEGESRGEMYGAEIKANDNAEYRSLIQFTSGTTLLSVGLKSCLFLRLGVGYLS